MKNDWSNTLTPNEEIVKEFSLGILFIKYSFYSWVLIGALSLMIAGLGIVVIPLVIFYWKYYILRAHQYAFTNKRVLVKRGWLNTKLISIDYDKITDVQVHEQFLSKKLYKTGSLIINTAGTSAHEVVLENVEYPHELRQALLDLVDKN